MFVKIKIVSAVKFTFHELFIQSCYFWQKMNYIYISDRRLGPEETCRDKYWNTTQTPKPLDYLVFVKMNNSKCLPYSV